MAECQENPLSIEEKEEDLGNKLSVNASQNDGKSHWQKSNIIDQCGNSQNNKDQENRRDRKVRGSGQTERGSEQRDSYCKVNISENSSRQEPEEKKSKVHTDHEQVEANKGSQTRIEENSGHIKGQEGPLHYAKQESMFGNGGKQFSGEDCNATKKGKEQGATEHGIGRASYSEATKTNMPPKRKKRPTTSEIKVLNPAI